MILEKIDNKRLLIFILFETCYPKIYFNETLNKICSNKFWPKKLIFKGGERNYFLKKYLTFIHFLTGSHKCDLLSVAEVSEGELEYPAKWINIVYWTSIYNIYNLIVCLFFCVQKTQNMMRKWGLKFLRQLK